MHDLRAEQFYQPPMVNVPVAASGGPIKTFPPRPGVTTRILE